MQPRPYNLVGVSGATSSCHVLIHPGPHAKPRHTDMDYSQARHSHPRRWLCSAFSSLSLFQPPLAPFPSLEISREPILLSRQPWVANHSRGLGDSWDPQHRKSTSPPCECLAGGQAVQGQRGKERRAVQEEKVWAGRLQARQPREGQSLVTCSCWSRMWLPEGSAEVETVEPGSGGR